MEPVLVTVCKVAGGMAIGLLLYDFFLVRRIRRRLEEEFDRARMRLPDIPRTPILSSRVPEAGEVAAAPDGVRPVLEVSGAADPTAAAGAAAGPTDVTAVATKRREVLFLEMQRRELEKYSKSLVDQQAKLDEERMRVQEDRRAIELQRVALEAERKRWAGMQAPTRPDLAPPSRPADPAPGAFTVP